MELYKRNRIELAISRMYEPASKSPSVALRTKLKRLLETDRKLQRSPRSLDPERANYAFFSAEAPGRGVEVGFSNYEAFALYTALRLLEHGLPQTEATLFMRRARPLLEPKHAEILQWFKHPDSNADAPRLYLAITTRRGRGGDPTANFTRTVDIFDGDFAFGIEGDETQLAMTGLELVHAARGLDRALSKTRSTRRGRAS
jgi:hypothetical protein